VLSVGGVDKVSRQYVVASTASAFLINLILSLHHTRPPVTWSRL